MKGGGGASALRLVLPPYIAAKVASLLIPVLTVWQASPTRNFPGGDEIRAAFAHWDGQWYTAIAERGYPRVIDFHLNADGHLYGFFPGYPMLIRAVMYLGFDSVTAGVLISAAMELLALYFLARLVLLERDADAARFSVWAFALYPFAFFLTAVYTESTFLAAAAAALYFSRRGDTGRAALCTAAACAVRLTGVALVPALLLDRYLRRRRLLDEQLLWVAVSAAPVALFALYSQVHSGDLLAFLHAQSSPSFNHHADFPWNGLRVTWAQVFGGGLPSSTVYVFALEVVFGIAGAVLVVALWLSPRFPRSLALYCTLVYLLAVSISFWLSVPRYELAMFPALIVAADWLRHRPQWRSAVVTGSAAVMGYGATVFAMGHWLG